MAGAWSKLKKSLSLKRSQRPPISAVPPPPQSFSFTSEVNSDSGSPPVSRSSAGSSPFSRIFSTKSKVIDSLPNPTFGFFWRIHSPDSFFPVTNFPGNSAKIPAFKTATFSQMALPIY